jgi:hypothetical protein
MQQLNRVKFNRALLKDGERREEGRKYSWNSLKRMN